MNRILITLILTIIVLSSYSQNIVPYLGQNGKYGLMNNEGELILNCQYDEIEINKEYNVLVTKQNGKYGLLNLSSVEEIIAPSFNMRPSYGNVHTSDWDKGSNNSIFDTLQAISFTNLRIIKLPNNSKKKYIFIQPFGYKTVKFKESYVSDMVYKYNLFKYKRYKGLVNFYHKDGYDLLKEDVVNGQVISDSRLAIEGKNGKLALMDFNEKLLTPYIYESIESISGDKYIVNYNQNSYRDNVKSNAGLMSDGGELIIDTIYTRIRPLFDKWLLVEKNKLHGVLDFKGEIIIDINKTYISEGNGNYIIIRHNEKSAVLDLNTRKIVLDSLKSCTYSKDRKFYRVRNKKGYGKILDKNLNLIYEGKFNDIKKVDDNKFILNYIPERKIIILEGGKIVKEFDDVADISRLRFTGAKKYYKIKNYSVQGLLDSNFNTILDMNFADIHEGGRKKFMLAAKIKKDGLYEFYDSVGNKLDIPPIADLGFSQGSLPFKNRYINGKSMLLFKDGTLRESPTYDYSRNVMGADGKMVFLSKTNDGSRYYILNEKLYNIIPEGYYIPTKYLNTRFIEFGLIPVFDDFNSGVIDLKGKWEIPPSYNKYEVYSPTIVVREYGLNEGVDLLLKKDGDWAEAKYAKITFYRDRGMMIAKKFIKGNNKRTIAGIINTDGGTLIPIKYQDVRFHKFFISGYKQTSDSTGFSDIYNLTGKLLFTTPYQVKYTNENSEYIKVLNTKRRTLEGIVDFENNVILEPVYRDLTYYKHYGLIRYNSEGNYKDRTTILSDLKGNVVYESKNFGVKLFKADSKKRIVLYENNKTMIYDENNNLIKSLDFKFYSKSNSFPKYFRCKDGDDRVIYISLIDGKVMADID